MSETGSDREKQDRATEDPSLAFASRMIGLAILALLVFGLPMAWARILPPFLDFWTILILVVLLLFLKRILKSETPTAAGEGAEEAWEDQANERVHEVKNLLMDFQPDQHGGPGGLADYLEQSHAILAETIGYLREKEKEFEEEPE
jgi:hypothetical protein